MTEDTQRESAEAAARAAAERKRRRAEVFGDVLPASTQDDRDLGADAGSRGTDAWLRANVPPHHG